MPDDRHFPPLAQAQVREKEKELLHAKAYLEARDDDNNAYSSQNMEMRQKLEEYEQTTQELNHQFEEQLLALNEQHQQILDEQKGTLEVGAPPTPTPPPSAAGS